MEFGVLASRASVKGRGRFTTAEWEHFTADKTIARTLALSRRTRTADRGGLAFLGEIARLQDLGFLAGCALVDRVLLQTALCAKDLRADILVGDTGACVGCADSIFRRGSLLTGSAR